MQRKQPTKKKLTTIDAACSDGRLTGQVTIAWYKQQAETNPDFVKADFVKAQLAAFAKIKSCFNSQTTHQHNQPNQQQVSDETLAVGLMGVDRNEA